MKRWDTFQLVFLAFCAALNVGIGAIVGIVKLPIYLDSIGTFIAAALGGWLYGATVGIIAVLIAAVAITPTSPAYAGTAIVIALCVSILVRYRFLKSLLVTIIGGLIVGVFAAIVSAPVTTYLYGGVSLAGADALTAFFKAMGNTLIESVILGGLATDPIDKLATSLIALSLLKALPKRLYQRFPNGRLFLPEKAKE
jgi:energy-coupling factor transport system substrate-specific component